MISNPKYLNSKILKVAFGFTLSCVFLSHEIQCRVFWLASSLGSSPPSPDSGIQTSSILGMLLSASPPRLCGRGRASWARHNCSQLPWPQDDTSICPCIRWWELSHATPYRCKGGWEIQFNCVPKKRKQTFWPPGQSVILRQTQPIPDTQPEWPTDSPLVRQTLSQCQQGPERWSGSTVYLDRWA